MQAARTIEEYEAILRDESADIIRSRSDLEAATERTGRLGLSPGTLQSFLESAIFKEPKDGNPGGLSSYMHDELERELTAENYVAFLGLFGLSPALTFQGIYRDYRCQGGIGGFCQAYQYATCIASFGACS